MQKFFFESYSYFYKKNFSNLFIFLILYFTICIISNYIFINIFNTSLADMYDYYVEAINISKNNSFQNIIFSKCSSCSINEPLIKIYAFLFKINESMLIVYAFNSMIYITIFIIINSILETINQKKINFLIFILCSGYLSFLNIGINKEIFLTLCIVGIFHCLLKMYTSEKLFVWNYFILSIFIILFYFIKPFHLFLLIFPIILIMIISNIKKIKFFYIFILILFLSILLYFMLDQIHFYYVSRLNGSVLFNIDQYININRINFYYIGTTNSNLSYFNTISAELDENLLSSKNVIIYLKSFFSSIIFPSFSDIIFGFKAPSRFIIFILFESTLMKIGLFSIIYYFIKEKSFNYVYLCYFIIIIYITFMISVNIPNDGIGYRYLYPYKFILIFLGFNMVTNLSYRLIKYIK